MRRQLLHIFRNTPAGRESLLTSELMSQLLGVPLVIWVPAHRRFVLRYGMHELVVSLDRSSLRSPETAEDNIARILGRESPRQLFAPRSFGDHDLPEIPTDFMIMTCPRVLREHSERVGLGHVGPGHIGPAVRSIVKHAAHPVLVPGAVFAPWRRVAVLYGGSPLGVESVQVGLELAKRCHQPLRVYTFARREAAAAAVEAALADAGLLDPVRASGEWLVWREGTFEEKLMDIPRDSLVLVGAAGHGAVRALFHTSKLKRMLEEWPGPLLVVGPETVL